MENNKLSTGLTVWLWIIFVVNVLAAIGGIVVALGASVVGAALGLGSIYVVLSFIGVIMNLKNISDCHNCFYRYFAFRTQKDWFGAYFCICSPGIHCKYGYICRYSTAWCW